MTFAEHLFKRRHFDQLVISGASRSRIPPSCVGLCASSRSWSSAGSGMPCRWDARGAVLKIRQATNPEPIHRAIYATLGISAELIKPLRTWHET
jgi:hypothetical protein